MSEPQGNAEAGKKVFQKNCGNCHNMALKGKHAIGPILGTAFGRKIGTISGFKFSSGLSSMGKKGDKWDVGKLHLWISNPGDFSAGTSMSFAGIKSEQERNDLIRYLYETKQSGSKK